MRHVPRLSWHYHCYAEYFFLRASFDGSGMTESDEHSLWFYLMAAWFYEIEDEELAAQGVLPFDGPAH